MSDDEAAFLRTIRENPDADLPRLVYADWLDERGHQVRAEFLRTHIELERLTEDSPRRRELAFWCRTQLDTQPHLLFEPPLQPKFARHGRGLIEAAEFWNASDGEIASAFHLAPLRRIWVYGLDRWLSQLKRVPVENCLHTLDLTGNRLTADALRYLGTVMRFPHLKELVLTGCDLDDDAARVLCERMPFRELEKIRVGANPFASGRIRLWDEFGTRLNFDSAESHDFDVLRRIQPSERCEAGGGDDFTQLLGEANYDTSRSYVFDYAGNLLETNGDHHPSTDAANEALTESLAARGLRSGPIRVKRFKLPSGLGLFPYPAWLTRALGGESDGYSDSAHVRFESWLEEGCSMLALIYGAGILNREGELTYD